MSIFTISIHSRKPVYSCVYQRVCISKYTALYCILYFRADGRPLTVWDFERSLLSDSQSPSSAQSGSSRPTATASTGTGTGLSWPLLERSAFEWAELSLDDGLVLSSASPHHTASKAHAGGGVRSAWPETRSCFSLICFLLCFQYKSCTLLTLYKDCELEE